MARLFSCISQNPIHFQYSFDPSRNNRSSAQGFGIGWYDGKKEVHIEKKKRSLLAESNALVQQKEILTDICIFHVRFANSGQIADHNCQPFSYKSWMFAHSGHVNKLALLEKLKAPFNTNYQSEEIDSEVLFRFLLQSIKEQGIPGGISTALKEACSPHGTNFILTDGSSTYGFRYGLPLYYLVRRTPNPFHALSQETGVSLTSEDLSQNPAIMISAEKLTDDNWMTMDDGELFTTHTNLKYKSTRIIFD